MSRYSEKLKDPRWQKKRLGVLERENWKCQCCSSSEWTLHVHHLIYTKCDPWDEPDSNLECLCEICHEFREDFNNFIMARTTISTAFCFQFFHFARKLRDARKVNFPNEDEMDAWKFVWHVKNPKTGAQNIAALKQIPK